MATPSPKPQKGGAAKSFEAHGRAQLRGVLVGPNSTLEPSTTHTTTEHARTSQEGKDTWHAWLKIE